MFKALVSTQKQVGAIKRDGKNPHLGNKFATLEAILSELVPILNENNLFLSQNVDYETTEGQKTWFVETIVWHAVDKTSDSIKLGKVPVINTKGDAQGLGSAITYARRYGLAAAFGLWQTDDDGHQATNNPGGDFHPAPPPPTKRKYTATGAVAAPSVAQVQDQQAPAQNKGVEAVITPIPPLGTVVADPAPAKVDAAAFNYLDNGHRKLLTMSLKSVPVPPAKLSNVRTYFESGAWQKDNLTADTDCIVQKIKELIA